MRGGIQFAMWTSLTSPGFQTILAVALQMFSKESAIIRSRIGGLECRLA